VIGRVGRRNFAGAVPPTPDGHPDGYENAALIAQTTTGPKAGRRFQPKHLEGIQERQSMKTVLFVSASPAHRKVYFQGLANHFDVLCVPRYASLDADVAALVYDMDDSERASDLAWLEGLGYPVVLLTSRDATAMPAAGNRCVLSYPVRMDEVLRALARLGVEPGPRP
jgi:hypothetical protein